MSVDAPSRPRTRPRTTGAALRTQRELIQSATRRSTRRAGRIVRTLPRWVWPLTLLLVVVMVGVVWINTARIGITTDTAALLEQERIALADLAEARLAKATLEASVLQAARDQLGMVPAASARIMRVEP